MIKTSNAIGIYREVWLVQEFSQVPFSSELTIILMISSWVWTHCHVVVLVWEIQGSTLSRQYMMLLQHQADCIRNSTSGTNLIYWPKFSGDLKPYIFYLWKKGVLNSAHEGSRLVSFCVCVLGAGFPTVPQERYINQSGITLRGGRPLFCTCYSSMTSGVIINWRAKTWLWHCMERFLNNARPCLWQKKIKLKKWT